MPGPRWSWACWNRGASGAFRMSGTGRHDESQALADCRGVGACDLPLRLSAVGHVRLPTRARAGQYACKCVLSGRCKFTPSRRSPACSRTELRRREASWGVPPGEEPVRNASELDTAGCLGEPAANWRSPDRKRKPAELRGSVSKRRRGTSGGWRRNGWKAEHMTQGHLLGTRRRPAGVRGARVALKPGNSGGAKGPRKMDAAGPDRRNPHRRKCRGLNKPEPTRAPTKSLCDFVGAGPHRRPGPCGCWRLWNREWKEATKGGDFHRWPNAFFAEQGLFSLVTAHAAACQSSRR